MLSALRSVACCGLLIKIMHIHDVDSHFPYLLWVCLCVLTPPSTTSNPTSLSYWAETMTCRACWRRSQKKLRGTAAIVVAQMCSLCFVSGLPQRACFGMTLWKDPGPGRGGETFLFVGIEIQVNIQDADLAQEMCDISTDLNPTAQKVELKHFGSQLSPYFHPQAHICSVNHQYTRRCQLEILLSNWAIPF